MSVLPGEDFSPGNRRCRWLGYFRRAYSSSEGEVSAPELTLLEFKAGPLPGLGEWVTA
jgi:hypothetical protein